MVKYTNSVRFIVKDGNQEAYIKLFNERHAWDGMISHILIQTGDKTFCSVGVWEDEASLVKNRGNMIAFLDTLRPMLEEISPELGVTDAVSGTVVAEV
jgi:quinol monooxygenase YgiN